jgi:hypothetical protein
MRTPRRTTWPVTRAVARRRATGNATLQGTVAATIHWWPPAVIREPQDAAEAGAAGDTATTSPAATAPSATSIRMQSPSHDASVVSITRESDAQAYLIGAESSVWRWVFPR